MNEVMGRAIVDRGAADGDRPRVLVPAAWGCVLGMVVLAWRGHPTERGGQRLK